MKAYYLGEATTAKYNNIAQEAKIDTTTKSGIYIYSSVSLTTVAALPITYALFGN